MIDAVELFTFKKNFIIEIKNGFETLSLMPHLKKVEIQTLEESKKFFDEIEGRKHN